MVEIAVDDETEELSVITELLLKRVKDGVGCAVELARDVEMKVKTVDDEAYSAQVDMVFFEFTDEGVAMAEVE